MLNFTDNNEPSHGSQALAWVRGGRRGRQPDYGSQSTTARKEPTCVLATERPRLQRDTSKGHFSSPKSPFESNRAAFGSKGSFWASNGPFCFKWPLWYFGSNKALPVSKRPFFGFEEAFSALKGLFGPCHDLVCPKTYNFYSLENVDPLKIVG